jgi:hypothetical protein
VSWQCQVSVCGNCVYGPIFSLSLSLFLEFSIHILRQTGSAQEQESMCTTGCFLPLFITFQKEHQLYERNN